MGKTIKRSFFEADEVLFVGYSKRHESFCEAIAEAYRKRGAAVYPVNPKPEAFSAKVWPRIEDVEGKPTFAYVLTNKKHNAAVVEALAARGVQRVLFQSSVSADKAILDRCAELGMEAALGCPMMVLGGGFHRFHGFLAGVRK